MDAVPVVEKKPLFMIKLRWYLTERLTHLYLKLSEMVELQDNDYDQSLEYLYCCKEMT